VDVLDVLDTTENPELREAQELEDEDPVCEPLGAHKCTYMDKIRRF